jgi:hypothetical protein
VINVVNEINVSSEKRLDGLKTVVKVALRQQDYVDFLRVQWQRHGDFASLHLPFAPCFLSSAPSLPQPLQNPLLHRRHPALHPAG